MTTSSFDPGDMATIRGSGFEPNTTFAIPVTQPDGAVEKTVARFLMAYARNGLNASCPGGATSCWDTVRTNASGSFDYDYLLGGGEGTYRVKVYPSSYSGPGSAATLASTSLSSGASTSPSSAPVARDGSGNADIATGVGCMEDFYDGGGSLNCTAEDIKVANATNINILDDGCAFPGDTVTFMADFEVVLNAEARHDIGIWFSEDGDPNGDAAISGTCTAATPAYGPDPPWLDLDGTNDDPGGAIQDTCGDIDSDHNPLFPSITLTVQCVDDDGNGLLDLPNCTSWRQPGANDLCTSPTQAFPGAPSKCKCDEGFNIDIPVPPGELTIEKTASPTTYDTVGQVISYSYLVTNSSNVGITNIAIADDKATDEACPALTTVGNGDSVLDPNEQITCTASYTITQADIDAGSVTNIASASGIDSNQNPVTSPPDDETVTADKNPALTLVKSTTTTAYAAVGDTIDYSYSVTNSGNVTLAGPVTITDNKTTAACADLTTIGDGDTDLDVGETVTCTAVDYVVTQADIDAGSVTNLATASAAGTDSNQDSVTVTADQNPDILITKTFAHDSVTAGGAGSFFTLVATNTGNVTLSDAVVADTVDARLNVTGVAVTTASAGGGEACALPSQNVSCTIPTLAVGESVTITVDFEVAASATPATVDNDTSVAAEAPQGDPQNPNDDVTDTGTDSVDIITSADLSIFKDDNPDPVSADNAYTVTYTVTVDNFGPSDAQNVVVTDTLPAEATLVSTTGCVEDPAGVPTCSLGTIAAGDFAQYTIVVTVAPPTELIVIENTVVVTSDTDDPFGDDNTFTQPTTIVPLGSLGDFVWLDINLNGIQDAGEPGVAGATVNLLDGNMTQLRTTTTDANGFYFFTNLADGNYYLQVIPPTGLALTLLNQGSDDTKDSDFDPTTGKSGLIELTVDTSEVGPSDPEGGPSERAPVILPPAAPVNFTFDAGLIGADVAITKTAAPATVTVGQTITYTLTVTNNGPTNASNVVVTDTLGAGLTLVSSTAGCGLTPSCSLGTIPVGGSKSYTIVATANVVGNATNAASVTATQPDLDVTNNQSSTTTPVSQVAASGIIGDTVFVDSNGNGIQDPGEPGIAGVTVTLTNTTTGATTTTVTNANGQYLFSGLAAGTYTVQVVASTLPPGVTATTKATVSVNLADGATFNQADFGFTPAPAALPTTGADNARVALIGLILLLAGGLLVLGVRWTRRDEGALEAVDS